jgi:hypothetical protein
MSVLEPGRESRDQSVYPKSAAKTLSPGAASETSLPAFEK